MEYEIRPLKLGEILDQSVKMLKKRLGLFLEIGACIIIPYAILNWVFITSKIPELPENPTRQDVIAL